MKEEYTYHDKLAEFVSSLRTTIDDLKRAKRDMVDDTELVLFAKNRVEAFKGKIFIRQVEFAQF
jgi:hypothetical protein